MDEPLRIGIYARISEDRDGQQTATSRQLEDCRAFAQRKGWEVADEFEDIDTSAFKTNVTRPEFLRMLGCLRSGEVDGVLVWKLDRLTRQQRDLVRVMEACEPHKAFVASVMEPIDTKESYGQFVAELLVAQARMESANASARQRRKARQQIEQGEPPPNGRRCFGYTRGYTAIEPEEAALLREARDRLLAGESLQGLCTDWEKRGVLTTGGKPWRTQILKRLLISSTPSGQREQNGKRFPGTWAAIYSVEDTERLRRLFSNSPGLGRKRAPTQSLLTGYIRCGLCHGRMFTSRTEGGKRRYTCLRRPGTGNCGGVSTLAEPVEELVAEMIFSVVDGEALAKALQTRRDDNDELFEAIRADESALELLTQDFYVERVLSREEFMSARSSLSHRLEANRERLARRDRRHVLRRFVGAGTALREAWQAGTLDWRRAIVGALLERVEVMPGRAGRVPFDPARVRPSWKN